ncbi:unnamed protein product [Prunus brigantina]
MMSLHVPCQGKRGYRTENVAQVEEDAPGFESWCIEDSIIKRWWIKTMETYLVELFLDLPTAKDVWESVAHMYYDASNESHIYQLRCRANRITQGGHDTTSYFAKLKSVWLELDPRHPINMKCPDDVKI